MQLDEWRARRVAAEKAMVIVEAALVRVSARTATPTAAATAAATITAVAMPARATDAAEAQAVARRFAEICSLHNLGVPLAYARWIVEFGRLMRGKETAKLYHESGEA